MLKSANGVVAYQAKDSSGTYVVIFNANNDAAAIDGVEAGKYEVLAADGTVYGDDDVKSVTVRKGSAYTAGALSATVLKVASADDVVPVISGVNESTTITVGSKFDPMAGVSATDDIDGDLTPIRTMAMPMARSTARPTIQRKTRRKARRRARQQAPTSPESPWPSWCSPLRRAC